MSRVRVCWHESLSLPGPAGRRRLAGDRDGAGGSDGLVGSFTALSARDRAARSIQAGSAAMLRDTGGMARPLRLAIETVSLVAATEAIVLPLGIVLAFFLFRTDVWGRGLLLAIIGLSAFVPLPLHATAWLGALAMPAALRLSASGRSWSASSGPRSCTRWRRCRGSS